ncbi:MAG TPA: hypothetical protein VHF01_09715 [Candidatus Acidoferrum sp.]|nr:hypothetical protein [Candidatus Acidoferrum sp.]
MRYLVEQDRTGLKLCQTGGGGGSAIGGGVGAEDALKARAGEWHSHRAIDREIDQEPVTMDGPRPDRSQEPDYSPPIQRT